MRQYHDREAFAVILVLMLAGLALADAGKWPFGREVRELEAIRTEVETSRAKAAALGDKLDELALAAERLREPKYLQFTTRNDLYLGAHVALMNSESKSRWTEIYGNPEQTIGAEVQSPGSLNQGMNTVWVGTRRGLVFGFNLPPATLLGNSQFSLIVSACPNAWGVPRLIAGSINDLGEFVVTKYVWPKDYAPSPAPADRPECK